MKLNIVDTFIKELPADPIKENSRRQVAEACFSYVTPKKTAKPELLHVSLDMLNAIGLSQEEASTPTFLKIITGNKILLDTSPFAMCYGGHQFGNWAGQLGDGRAINLAEVECKNQRWMLQLKGAGETPYSRRADGLAVLRSSIREYLCSEAMHYLGVPTTRALSLALTGDEVLRDIMYNGNSEYEKGAIVCRVAPSFLRFGSYQIFAARQDVRTLKKLVDYTIKQFYPELGKPSKTTYLHFFEAVLNKTLETIIHWQRVGFVHGVMNTDNMSILGHTIDYGPYGWLEGYDHNWTPNTTDNQFKRYRYGAQLDVGFWNLYQLANALYPIIGEAKGLEDILNSYKEKEEQQYLAMMRNKLGLFSEEKTDRNLILNLEEILQLTETDMTIFFRNLSLFSIEKPLDGVNIIKDAFYEPDGVSIDINKKWIAWFQDYASRLNRDDSTTEERRKKMNTVNPKYVLRNYMAQLAIDAANKGDYKVIDELFKMLKKPYNEQPEYEKWYAKRPEWARHKVGCSMLSCSS